MGELHIMSAGHFVVNDSIIDKLTENGYNAEVL